MTPSRVKRACNEESSQTARMVSSEAEDEMEFCKTEGYRKMRNKRPVKGAKGGSRSQKLNGPLRLLRTGRCGQGGAALCTEGSASKFGW